MKCMIIVAMALSVAAAMGADPSVSGVALAQDPVSRVVRVDYTLSGADAIVTLDVTTNGVSVGAANLTGLTGDVNAKVAPGARSILWHPNRTLGVAVAEGVKVEAHVTAWRLDTPPDYLVVNVELPGTPRYFTCAEAIDGGIANDIYKTSFMVLRKCPAKNVIWRMGSNSNESFHLDDQAAHLVKFTNDFYMAIYQCTQYQYAFVRGLGYSANCNYNRDSHSDWMTHPMETASYDDIRGSSAGAQWPASDEVDDGSFLKNLRDRTGLRFDLPTEAQWEYACRAGTGTAWNWGSNDTAQMDDYVWSTYNSGRTTHVVGTLKPNAWGIYDMHGNVWELCRDWYGEYEFAAPDIPVVSPVGPSHGSARCIRPGGYTNNHTAMYSAFRNSCESNRAEGYIGFRVVLEVH